ncbi:MAG: M23 family metallopeptidase, partial [Bacteroidota bacterium]
GFVAFALLCFSLAALGALGGGGGPGPLCSPAPPPPDSLYIFHENRAAIATQHFVDAERGAIAQAIASDTLVVLPPSTELLRWFALPLALGDSATLVQALRFGGVYGDPEATPDTSARYQWPFPAGRSYKVIQAYRGRFSHQSNFSRYAVDFALAVGDTVTAAREGVVIRVVEQHDRGGNSRRYRPYANFVTLAHADGMMTQYVHLVLGGSFVAVGDSVQAGQPIGISGMTGFTSSPHLHFNTLRAVHRDAASFPVAFKDIAGEDLRAGMTVGH